ncbi:GIY-YIG nuclease family protein [Kamptonema formosum]|uniref:GIY-YIG nuclease family protein n=1 Tax=Kamptonema formosum TaxID=331992 RepID=UPI00034B9977|nr:GIY-YIG nuclease family protein [Oscillatoria sp. PCC 10802]
MTAGTDIPSLATLEYMPYLDAGGQIPEEFQGKIGVYAIFDAEKVLQYVGYSRDVSLSLKQHLVRSPQQCYWLKAQTIERPSRTILETIRESWIAENGAPPAGNAGDEAKWTQAIDVRMLMTPEEKANYEKAAGQELEQVKVLKQVARRVQADILASLEARGVRMELRFNPKIKENGLLDLK